MRQSFTRPQALSGKAVPAMPDPLAQISTRATPQSEQADSRQVPNSAGGFTFTVERTARLHRFLTLGTDRGTYYASERDITRQNAAIVLQWARESATELVTEADSRAHCRTMAAFWRVMSRS